MRSEKVPKTATVNEFSDPSAQLMFVLVLNLYSLVECLTQRRRETESAEKSQKSERKERYDKKRPENFFHPIGENNYDAN